MHETIVWTIIVEESQYSTLLPTTRPDIIPSLYDNDPPYTDSDMTSTHYINDIM